MCVRVHTGWVNGSFQILLAIPMVWSEPEDHSSDCYFCLTNITGLTSKSKHELKYPDLLSAMRPVPHSEELPVPRPWEDLTPSGDNSDSYEGRGQYRL